MEHILKIKRFRTSASFTLLLSVIISDCSSFGRAPRSGAFRTRGGTLRPRGGTLRPRGGVLKSGGGVLSQWKIQSGNT